MSCRAIERALEARIALKQGQMYDLIDRCNGLRVPGLQIDRSIPALPEDPTLLDYPNLPMDESSLLSHLFVPTQPAYHCTTCNMHLPADSAIVKMHIASTLHRSNIAGLQQVSYCISAIVNVRFNIIYFITTTSLHLQTVGGAAQHGHMPALSVPTEAMLARVRELLNVTVVDHKV